ncbi:RNB-domain-containing protein [Zalerion maritima]|uniref:RNB-domain-containing protein n=1 Tax=Zalerion maritima TaxID=339359 RepID=A0AAD5RU12_9PEZI|nr:RNB-domain-containing protein [Zalerion maritima]
MLSRPVRQYVCWRCLGRNPISPSPRHVDRTYANVARSWNLRLTSDAAKDYELLGRISVREKLKQWERENTQEKIPVHTPAMHHGSISNIVQDKSVDELEVKDDFGVSGALEDDSATIRVSALTPGTLVEKTMSGHTTPILSVMISYVGPYHLLCSMRGQISLELQPYSAFTIKGFINPIKFLPLIEALPPDLAERYQANTLLDLPTQQLMAHAAPVVRQIKDFVEQVDKVYRDHAKTMDALLSKVSDPEKHTYRTLPELATAAFGKAHRRPNGTYSPAALYAVHRTLISGDFGAQPLVPPSALYTNEYYYEVPPRSDLDDIKMVDEQVKKFSMFKKNVTMNEDKEKERVFFLRSGGLPLVSFLVKARKLIDQSRERAARSASGTCIPGNSGPGQSTKWTEDDLRILRVLEMWAGYEKFSSRSRLHMLGPMILRAVERYKDVFNLSQSVGWTFLKEVGWIPPWEVRARYKLLPPSVGAIRGGGFSRPTDGVNIEESLSPDFWEGRRKRWDITAFAIDSASTEFIDDAVSLEKAEEPGHWWIHVHVADPASQIQPESAAAKHAQALPLTVWMPFHHTSMLPYEWVGDRFSLGQDKICLTFSSRVDDEGKIVEAKVTPGVLGKVVYMTPNEANRVVQEGYQPKMEEPRFSVGGGTGDRDATRPLTTAEGLDEDDRSTLRILDELARKRKQLGLKLGATPSFPAKAQVEGSLAKRSRSNGDAAAAAAEENGEADLWSVDPYIELRMTNSNAASSDYSPTVHQSMLVGCEAAARWCADRQIPIPYLSHPVPQENVSAIVEKLDKTIYPILRAGKQPSPQEWMKMISMIGWQTIGTKPGPFIFHGQEMYAKVTSPLRRYSDMLCHWQIHGWMKMEAESAEKGSSKHLKVENLPFSGKKLDGEIIPMLRVRERLIVQATRNGNKEISLQALVRAWKLGETIEGQKEFPKKFRFEVQQYSSQRKMVRGRLDWFGIDACFGREEIGEVVEGDGVSGVAFSRRARGEGSSPVEIPNDDPPENEEDDDDPEEEKEDDDGEEDEEDQPDLEVQKEEEPVIKPPGTPLRFKDLEPGDVLEAELKDVDVALQYVLMRPIKRVHVAERMTTEMAKRNVHYW